ncbi:MAG: SIS domain-containing protein [Candidatus Saccharimonadales bacterium]|nr:SIS domain-containing protein [Candidatus Saccharimonadales bacterium]
MLDDLKFINQKDPNDQLGAIERNWRDKSDLLARAAIEWRADNPTSNNLAKQIAEHLAGKSVVVYAEDEALAKTWMKNIAQKAHNRVFISTLDDESTELAAWSSHPVDKLFAIVILRQGKDSDEYSNTIKTLRQKLSGRWPHPLEIELPDENNWAEFLAEMTAAYLAILNGVITNKKDL